MRSWLPRFSGTVKQESAKGKRDQGGKSLKYWRLIVKYLEIPQEVMQAEEGKEKVKMESHHPSMAPLAGLSLKHWALLVSPRITHPPQRWGLKKENPLTGLLYG